MSANEWFLCNAEVLPIASDSGDLSGLLVGVRHAELTVSDRSQRAAATLFQAVMAVPGRVIPNDPAVEAAVLIGEQRFRAIGCASCHVPSLPLDRQGWLYVEPNPYQRLDLGASRLEAHQAGGAPPLQRGGPVDSAGALPRASVVARSAARPGRTSCQP